MLYGRLAVLMLNRDNVRESGMESKAELPLPELTQAAKLRSPRISLQRLR